MFARKLDVCSRFELWLESLHILQELVGVLAHEGLGVVASDVVPLDPVVVDVIEDAHARLHAAVDVELRVVRLRHVVGHELGLVAGEGPGLVAPAGRRGVGGRHLDAGPGPEPPVHGGRLQILAVAALEVAEPARGPDVGEVVVLDELLDELVLGGGLEADEVHAVLPADVPAVQPVNLVISKVFFVSREPVVVTAMLEMFGSWNYFKIKFQ